MSDNNSINRGNRAKHIELITDDDSVVDLCELDEALKPFMVFDKAKIECEQILYCSSNKEPVVSWKEYYQYKECDKRDGDICRHPRCKYMKLVVADEIDSIRCGRNCLK